MKTLWYPERQIMFTEKEIKNLCDALKAFKCHVYTSQLEEALKNTNGLKPAEVSENEFSLHVFREVLSRFLIDLYDILDRATKELNNEKEIDQFWKTAGKCLDEAFKSWIDDCEKKCPELKNHSNQIISDLTEFQERAIKFHKERQLFSLTLRSKIMNQEAIPKT